MKATYRHSVAALVVAAGILASAQAFADPPGRAARLNYFKGSVSFRPAEIDDWAPATLNYPLTTGDHLWTDSNSWAELHVGSTAMRLAPTTAFAFLNLDDRTAQIRLSEGALDVRVRNLDGGEEFEIDTPSAAIVLTRPGVYRVDVLPDGGSTRVTVRFGMASVSADGPDFWVRDGETAAIYGTDEVSHEIFRAGAPDNWERWCRARDEREDRAASLRYVSYEMTGYEDLDDYGTWNNVPEYGWGWQPRVAVGWAPYRYGHWRWISPWGWTWVDDAAWGFAPFHYGRWACLRGSWWWFPGSYVLRPIYAPALVAFIGGDHWGLSIGFGRGHIGWFPLAPGELWWPHYRASHTYIRNLNITNVRVTNINFNNYDVSRGTYVNRAIGGAVTAVPRDAFLGGRAVARDAVSLDARAVMRAPVIGGSAPVAPRADSILGSRRGNAVPRPPSMALDRTVVARSQPAAAPVPFAAQERAIQANGGRPLDDGALARLRNSGDRGSTPPVRIAGARGVRGGPARGDQPATVGTPTESYGGGGTAVRRSGERPAAAGGSRPDAAGQPVGGIGGAGANDRPSWARPRGGGEVQPTNPRYYGDDRAGARARPGGASDNRPAGGAAGMPDPGAGAARPRSGGERTNPRGESGQPANDRPVFGRPSGGDNTRPSGGENARPSGGDNARPSGGDNSRPASGDGSRGGAVGGARSRGGETARPAPDSKGSAPAARPRSGGRGGDSAFYESSSRPGFANDRPSYSAGSRTMNGNDRPSAGYTNERPSYSVGSRAGSGNDRPASGYATGRQSYGSGSFSRTAPAPSQGGGQPSRLSDRPSAGYRAMPESRPTPQYRAAPEYRSMPQSRPTPQYRATPDYRPTPEARPTPQYRSMPESRPTPQYRAVPEYRSTPQSRPTPQYRSMPESRPTPQYRAAPEGRSFGGAVERRGGGGGAPSAAPAPRSQGGGGGQAAPRGGTRNRGRGE